MNMSEYLQKKNLEGQKTTQDRMKELQDAEKRAREIRESLRVEKKKEFEEKIHNFHLFGMSFRPWTLNDMVIFLLIGIIVIGALSFVPGKEVSSDTENNKDGSFFTKLFGGFTVKSVENTGEDVNQEAPVLNDLNTSGNTDSGQTETQTPPVVEENVDLTNYNFEIKYKDSVFTTLNSTGTDMLWYTLSVRNLEAYNIKCDVDHYVNDKLKDDKSTVTVESEKSADIMLKEMKADAVDTLSRVKVVITCWDSINENTKNEKLQKLKFYFS